MGEVKQYVGSCHCGKVRYQVSLDLSQPTTACNCSICGRTGTLLSFVPAAHFKLEQGEDVLTNYQFNKKVIQHLFCSTCGVRSFARGKMPDGTEMVAINARCLEGVDSFTLPTKQFDGRNKA
ncbi:MAG: GFA family protein [Polyangiales bacterium]